MKKIILFILMAFVIAKYSFSQVPQKMNYQAVARNSAGVSLQNQNIGLRLTVHDASLAGPVIYQETQSSVTNQFGLFSIEIGSGTVLSGTFPGIDWGSGNKFLQVEMDVSGGIAYADMGASQLISVPYALYAANAPVGATGPTGNTGQQGVQGATGPAGAANANGTINYIPKFTPDGITLGNSQIYDDNDNVGIGTASPTAKLNISVSGYDASSGLEITNTRTNGKTLSINQGSLGRLNFTEPGVIDLVTMDFNAQAVGINKTSPYYPLDVSGGASMVSAYFVNANAGEAVYAVSNTNTSGYGIAMYAEGGGCGVEAYAMVSGTGSRTGVYGNGSGGTTNYGVWGVASSGTTAYGVYGNASGATTSWAGYFSGNVYSTGSYQSSDRKLKDNIQPLSNALSVIQQLNPCSYTFKTNEYKQMNLPEGLQYGLIADEVKKIIPGAVKEAIQPAEFENNNDHQRKKIQDEISFSAINYTEVIPVLIAGMKDQQMMIEELKKQIESMRVLLEMNQK